MMKSIKRVIAIMLCLSAILSLSLSASAADIVQGCTVPPDGPNSISAGYASLDDSAGYDILTQFDMHFVVQVDADTLPEDVRSTLSPTVTSVDVPLYATVTVAQKRNTTRLTTTVVVRPESLLDTPLIRSFHVSNKCVNYTDFSIPDSYDSFTVSTNSPINYLEGSHDSPQSFVSGHEIAISVTISNVVLDNGTWSGSPVTASRRVTIR